MYLTSYHLHEQTQEIINIRDQILGKIDAVQVDYHIIETQKNLDVFSKAVKTGTQERSNSAKPKRFRRTNEMIQKPYNCMFPKCDKIYAS